MMFPLCISRSHFSVLGRVPLHYQLTTYNTSLACLKHNKSIADKTNWLVYTAFALVKRGSITAYFCNGLLLKHIYYPLRLSIRTNSSPPASLSLALRFFIYLFSAAWWFPVRADYSETDWSLGTIQPWASCNASSSAAHASLMGHRIYRRRAACAKAIYITEPSIRQSVEDLKAGESHGEGEVFGTL